MQKRSITVLMFTLAGLAFVGVQFLSVSANSDELQRPRTESTNGALRSASQDKAVNRGERRLFMRSKLRMVQKIVEGIATEDFSMVEDGGMELVAIAETAAWKSTRDPYYSHYSANFEQSARGLVAAAKSKSVAKATFAYVHVTFSCTACHQHVRGTLHTAQ